MSIITHDKILEEMKKGNIKIEPFSITQLGPASADLHLGNIFRIFKKEPRIINVDSKTDVEKITTLVKVEKGKNLLLKPGQTVLGITIEKISLSPNICGWLEGRSRYSRVGLAVHTTASFMQPGISNHQVLEITNVGSSTVALHPGTPICQFIFERCEGEAVYKGKYKNQTTP